MNSAHRSDPIKKWNSSYSPPITLRHEFLLPVWWRAQRVDVMLTTPILKGGQLTLEAQFTLTAPMRFRLVMSITRLGQNVPHLNYWEWLFTCNFTAWFLHQQRIDFYWLNFPSCVKWCLFNLLFLAWLYSFWERKRTYYRRFKWAPGLRFWTKNSVATTDKLTN